MNQVLRWCIGLGVGLLLGRGARADVVLLMEDPINFTGRITSSGHAAVWLDRLCSDDHLTMRSCAAGETGSVISRYQSVAGGFDWLAIDPAAYFFAVDRESQIPAAASSEAVEKLRTEYRAKHGASFAVDPGEATWVSLLGESYRRRIVLIRVQTTAVQEARVMRWLNDRRNVSRFNLVYNNCGDFVSKLLNVVFPGAVHRSYLLDAGMTTPKQLEFKLHRYALKHPEMGWEATLLPQVPGSVPRSGHLYGVTESYLKTYPYLLPLDYLLPIELGLVTGLGLCDHRYVAKPEVRADAAIFFRSADVAASRY